MNKKTTRKPFVTLLLPSSVDFFNQYLKNAAKKQEKKDCDRYYLETGDACWDCCAWSVVEEAEEYDDGRTAVAAWLRNCV